uniref:hypothetical protein n=1 Tax=Paenarthrobacter nicotinovorans TaxID=29320 RepID=UPI003F495AB4
MNRATPSKYVEWNLLINALVEIRQHDQVIRTGFVDDVMPDSSALWVAFDGVQPRQIFEVARGHEVWVTPQELRGDLNYRMTATQIFGNPQHESSEQLSDSAAKLIWG